MPAITCVIKHGAISASGLVDEPNILVQSLTVSAVREKKEYRGGSGCVKALKYINPILKFEFDGLVSSLAGLADQHPGTTVATLANYQGARFGFDHSDGVIVYEDPSHEESIGDPTKIKFSAVQYPFVE